MPSRQLATVAWQVAAARPVQLALLAPIWQAMMREHAAAHPAFCLHADALARWRVTMLDMMAQAACFVMVAHGRGGALGGYCSGWWTAAAPIYRQQRVGVLSELAVAAPHARQGVGRALAGAAGHWFAGQQVPFFEVSAALHNQAARAFWSSQGGEAVMLRYRFCSQPPGPSGPSGPEGAGASTRPS